MVAKRLGALPVGALAWWQCALGAAVLWVAPVRQGWPAWGASWAWLAGLGLIHTGLAYTLMYAGMARLATARVAVLQFAYPDSRHRGGLGVLSAHLGRMADGRCGADAGGHRGGAWRARRNLRTACADGAAPHNIGCDRH